jgi:hypothetical protein
MLVGIGRVDLTAKFGDREYGEGDGRAVAVAAGVVVPAAGRLAEKDGGCRRYGGAVWGLRKMRAGNRRGGDR